MKDQLISFKTAKLAKEKGFIHMKANCYGDNMCYQLPGGELINALKGNIITGYILAPTQSLLQKWLREKYEIDITILIVGFDNYQYTIHKKRVHIYTIDNEVTPENYKNVYKDTLEKALIESLKLI